MTTEPCTRTEDEVLAFVAGDLEGDAALELAQHLAGCPACCEQAAEFAALLGELRATRDLAIRWHAFRTPFGTMHLAATERGLARLSWLEPGPGRFERELARRFPGRPVVRDPAALAEAERQLREYFAGRRTRFELPVDLEAVGPFERRVLEATREIPYGDVVPYAELARRIGRPGAARAVGTALGHNPVAIVVPCHRVVRSDGSLGGYTGGVEYKRRLLALEGRRERIRAG